MSNVLIVDLELQELMRYVRYIIKNDVEELLFIFLVIFHCYDILHAYEPTTMTTSNPTGHNTEEAF